MGSFSLSEMVTIVIVILIIFGPNRLPEMARKAGAFVAKTRQMASSFTSEIKAEYGDTIEPLRAVRQDLRGIRDEMREGIASLDKGIRSTMDPSAPNTGNATRADGAPQTPPPPEGDAHQATGEASQTSGEAQQIDGGTEGRRDTGETRGNGDA